MNRDKAFEIMSGDRKAWREDYERLPWETFRRRTYGVGSRLYFSWVAAFALLGLVLATVWHVALGEGALQFWVAYTVSASAAFTINWAVAFGCKWWPR